MTKLICLLLLCASVWAQDVMVVRRRAAGGGTISGCSGAMTATGSTGCDKRELFEGATSCYGGFASTCNYAWYYVAGSMNFAYTTSPLQGANSALLGNTGTDKAFLAYTAGSTIYAGAAISVASYKTADTSRILQLETTADVSICRMHFYDSTHLEVLNAGGTTQNTTITATTGTTYYARIRATAGTGANAVCTAELSTNGTSWNYSVSSTNGTWTTNTGYLHVESAAIKYDDIRVATTAFNYW